MSTRKPDPTGRIINRHGAVATADQLPGARINAMVQIGDSCLGIVSAVDPSGTTILCLDPTNVKVHDPVTITMTHCSVTLPKDLMGAVISPIGTSLIDRKEGETFSLLLDGKPLGLERRAPVQKAFTTKVGIVEVLVPQAAGQRTVIAGGRSTGKSQLALSIAIAAAQQGLAVIYCAVHSPKTNLHQSLSVLSQHGVLDRCVVVASTADEAAPLSMLAPHTAMAIAEHLRDQDQSSVVIFDSLTNHAQLVREMALLQRSFPGRESYPSDMFFQHARLLERAGAFLSPTASDPVTITAYALADTSQADLSEHVVSNLISITDGHFFTDEQRFKRGLRPTVHPGLSVTRVGKQTQNLLERSITQHLIEFMQDYQVASSATHFAAEISAETQRTLQRGRQLEALLTQQSYTQLSNLTIYILVSAIWHGWIATATTQTLLQYRDRLEQAINRDVTLQPILTGWLKQSADFPEFLKVTGEYQKQIMSVCQA